MSAPDPTLVPALRDLAATPFEAQVIAALPVDADNDPAPRAVPGVSLSRVRPTPVVSPRLLAWSDTLGCELGLARPAPGSAALAILAGNGLAPGMQPYAARYGGHQFGRWAGQLGDGRAITLGELPRPMGDGAGGTAYELQLKGAGMTPYSRHADGRAVLRSSLREFVCSEAMHALGVPTTRALSLVGTGEAVLRDMFYDGNARTEPGAIVCRVAPTFLRFGNYEIHAALGERESLQRLLAHTLRRHYPHIDSTDPAAPLQWLSEVCERTAVMVAHWMRVGFVHGVMNTDNMSILGLTLDYGPYGFLEGYDPQWTPNTTDAAGRRYAYGQQPQVALWNLSRLAGALRPLVDADDGLHAALERYRDLFGRTHRAMSAAKLGLGSLAEPGDVEWLDELFGLLAATETDMPIFFRQLSASVPGAGAASGGGDAAALLAPVRAALYDPDTLDAALAARWRQWLLRWQQRITHDLTHEKSSAELIVARMDAVNPLYLPRNYLAQEAIDAAEQGDLAPLLALMRVLQRPYAAQAGCEAYAARRPEWARQRPGCSALSCSS
jgi:uncharacterized protein YdiU (UPF0061 family)